MSVAKLAAVVATVLAVATTAGCTSSRPLPGGLSIDVSSDVHICLLDQASSSVAGTALPLWLHYDTPKGDWTRESIPASPAERVTVTSSWVITDPNRSDSVFGYGYPVPPTSAFPAQQEAWQGRQSIPGARIVGDASSYVVLLQLNRTDATDGKLTGLVLTYSDSTGHHEQAVAGFSVLLKSPGASC
jgi:hypothetical protein